MDNGMVDMKRTAGVDVGPGASAGGPGYALGAGEVYPGGLRICLEAPELLKLGLTELPPVGESMKINAQVIVVSVSQDANPNGAAGKSMSLQITHIGLLRAKDDKARLADRLYGADQGEGE